MRHTPEAWQCTGPLSAGSLSEEEATPGLNACLDVLYGALAALPPATGAVTPGVAGYNARAQWLAT